MTFKEYLIEQATTKKEDPKKVKPKAPKKASTPEEREKKRAKRWAKTGVSSGTVAWMKKNGML